MYNVFACSFEKNLFLTKGNVIFTDGPINFWKRGIGLAKALLIIATSIKFGLTLNIWMIICAPREKPIITTFFPFEIRSTMPNTFSALDEIVKFDQSFLRPCTVKQIV